MNQAEEKLQQLQDAVAVLIDRDFYWLGNSATIHFRSHAEATRIVNDLRSMAGVNPRVDLINPPPLKPKQS